MRRSLLELRLEGAVGSGSVEQDRANARAAAPIGVDARSGLVVRAVVRIGVASNLRGIAREDKPNAADKIG